MTATPLSERMRAAAGPCGPDKHRQLAGLVDQFADEVRALESRSLVDRVPEGYTLVGIHRYKDGYQAQLWNNTHKGSEYCFDGFGPTPEAAVENAASKVKP